MQDRLNKKIEEFKQKGVEIIKNDVKIEKENGKYVAKGKLTLKEPIAVLKKSAGTVSGDINDE